MSAANFAPSLACVLKSEGGFVNNRFDPGGATHDGVTQHQYDLWRLANKLPTQSVQLIAQSEIETLYRSWYWNAISADLLPAGVDYCTFDCTVNSGPFEASKWLQQAAGVNADGHIGPVTIAALANADPRRLINGICNERLSYLRTLPTWTHFGDGWTNRVNSVEITARGMV